jgi:succinyl-diaminopimelate desuccinylase
MNVCAMTTAVDHARNLIRCPSVTPQEAGALSYIERELSGFGFECHRISFSDEASPTVDNLYARLGRDAPHVCFAGHTDVVPPGDETAWRHGPFAGDIEGGVLYGRGAADMKGAVAASLAAVQEFLRERGQAFHGSISFLITGDEEGPAINGTVKVVDWLIGKNERPDCCLLGECTSEDSVGDTVKIGRRGSLSGRLTVRGVQGHVAYPQKARNPLPRLIDALALLKQKPLDAGSSHFQPSNLEITSIDTGNETTNLIPAAASARFNIRFNDRHTADSLKATIEEQVASALAETGVTFSLEWERQPADTFVTEPAGFVQSLSAAIEAETGRKPSLSTAGGTSDARFIKDLCPVVEVGLLNATAHKVDECVALADLEALTRIYKRFLETTLVAP